MDTWLEYDIESLKRGAASELRRNLRSKENGNDSLQVLTVVVSIPAQEQNDDERRPRVRSGHDDGKLRADRYEVVILVKTSNRLVICECTLDFVTGLPSVFTKDALPCHNVGSLMSKHRWERLPAPLIDSVEAVYGGIRLDITHQGVLFVILGAESRAIRLGVYSGDTQNGQIEVAWPGNDEALRLLS